MKSLHLVAGDGGLIFGQCHLNISIWEFFSSMVSDTQLVLYAAWKIVGSSSIAGSKVSVADSF